MGGMRRTVIAGAAIVGVTACALVVGTVSRASSPAGTAAAPFVSGGPPPGTPLDHFICYSAKVPTSGGPKIPSPVRLQDEFASQPETVAVQIPNTVCAPAAKIHGVLAVFPIFQDIHLTCFRIVPPTTEVPHAVLVDNQFNPLSTAASGDQRRPLTAYPTPASSPVVNGYPARSLCLPSHKSLDPAAPPPPRGDLSRVDHFDCYPAAPTVGAVQPAGLPATVKIHDQFSPAGTFQTVVVGKVQQVCNPTVKIVDLPGGPVTTPVTHPELHLVCFAIARGGTVFPNLQNVYVDNQFNPLGTPRPLQLVKAVRLCAPSFKALVG